MECEVCSVECGVIGVKREASSGVRNFKCKVWSGEWGFQSAECKV